MTRAPVYDPEDVFAFITKFHNAHGYPPSVRDIMRGCEMSSPSVAFYHLKRLEEQGKVKIVPGIARGVVVL